MICDSIFVLTDLSALRIKYICCIRRAKPPMPNNRRKPEILSYLKNCYRRLLEYVGHPLSLYLHINFFPLPAR